MVIWQFVFIYEQIFYIFVVFIWSFVYDVIFIFFEMCFFVVFDDYSK